MVECAILEIKRIKSSPSHDLVASSIPCHLLADKLPHRLLNQDMDLAIQRSRQQIKSDLVQYPREHKRTYQPSQSALIRNRRLSFFERTNYLSTHRPLLGRSL